MKTRHMVILIVFQAIVISLILIWIVPNKQRSWPYPELLREESPDGSFVLIVKETENSHDHSCRDIRVTLCENVSGASGYIATMDVSVHVGNNSIKLEPKWSQEDVQIDIIGVRLFRCILPLKRTAYN